MKKFNLRISVLFLTLGISITLFADSKASYPGGEDAMKEYLASNLQYPAAAKQNGIEGVVNVSFVVKADGSIGTIKIARLIDPDLEQEAIRLVKNMPAWTPAEKDGKAVDSTTEIAIPFQIPGE